MMNNEEADRLVRTEDPILVEQGLRHYRRQAEEDPKDAERWFLFGGALDFTDHPAEAIVAYHRVFALGVDQLSPDDQPKLFIQAGSTLRNLGRLDEARSLLAEGVQRYPTCRALPVFLALVEVSAGRDRQAVDLLFDALLARGQDDSIDRYRRALTWYANEIRQAE